MHRFLRIKGGFLRVDLDSARKIFYFYNHFVDASVVYEESFKSLRIHIFYVKKYHTMGYFTLRP